MKTLKIMLLFVATLAMLNACNNNEEKFADPKITLPANEERDFSNEVALLFKVKIEAEAKIDKIKITERLYAADNDMTSKDITSTQDGLKSYSGNTTFEFNFDKIYTVAELDGKVKLELVFDVTDKEGVTKTKIYTVTKKAGEEPGPEETPLSDWSDEITMGMEGQSVGTYPADAGEVYGFKYKTNGDGSNMHIEAIGGAQFVLVTEDFTMQEDLIAAYNEGTKENVVYQPFVGGAKSFSSKMFISHVGDKYYLIKTTAAVQHHSSAPGSFIKFVEKH